MTFRFISSYQAESFFRVGYDGPELCWQHPLGLLEPSVRAICNPSMDFDKEVLGRVNTVRLQYGEITPVIYSAFVDFIQQRRTEDETAIAAQYAKYGVEPTALDPLIIPRPVFWQDGWVTPEWYPAPVKWLIYNEICGEIDCDGCEILGYDVTLIRDGDIEEKLHCRRFHRIHELVTEHGLRMTGDSHFYARPVAA